MFEEVDFPTRVSAVRELADRLRGLPAGKAVKVTCAEMGWKDQSNEALRTGLREALLRLGVRLATRTVDGFLVVWEKREPDIEEGR